jgi:hypothetical protein
MKAKCSSAVFLLAILMILTMPASAQPYCANFIDGTQTCGIPTLESCRESISGVGGNCVIDQTSQLPPNLLQRLEQANPNAPLFQPNLPSAPSGQLPNGPNWMPPPPGQ